MLKFREMCVTLHGILEKRHIFDETDQDNIPADSHTLRSTDRMYKNRRQRDNTL